MCDMVFSKCTYEIITMIISLFISGFKRTEYLLISYFDAVSESSFFSGFLKILWEKLALLVEVISGTNIN